MAYGSAARGGSGAAIKAPPDRGRPCETEPTGGGGTFCILATGRGRVLSISNRDAEIGIPGDACRSKVKKAGLHMSSQNRNVGMNIVKRGATQHMQIQHTVVAALVMRI